MSKYECALTGDFNELLGIIDSEIIHGSISASFEDGSNCRMGEIRCAVRVYERYSMIGGNRVSLNVTLLGEGRRLFLSAIASGGSQALFFKINTFGENAFLQRLEEIVESYKSRNPN